jgi:hypothetical protein
MTTKIARAARMFADKLEAKSTAHQNASRQLIALAFSLAADPVEMLRHRAASASSASVKAALTKAAQSVAAAGRLAADKADPLVVLRQQIDLAKDAEVKKALEEVLEKLEGLRSKAASVLAADDKTVFTRMSEMFPDGAPKTPQDDKAVFARIEDVLGDSASDPEVKRAVEELMRALEQSGQTKSASARRLAVDGVIDASTLIKTLEGALRAGKLTPEQEKNAKLLLQQLQESSQDKQEKVAARLAARFAR